MWQKRGKGDGEKVSRIRGKTPIQGKQNKKPARYHLLACEVKPLLPWGRRLKLTLFCRILAPDDDEAEHF